MFNKNKILMICLILSIVILLPGSIYGEETVNSNVNADLNSDLTVNNIVGEDISLLNLDNTSIVNSVYSNSNKAIMKNTEHENETEVINNSNINNENYDEIIKKSYSTGNYGDGLDSTGNYGDGLLSTGNGQYSTTIFLISDNPGTNILDTAASEILQDKEYSEVNIIVRNPSQIKLMSESELYSLLSTCDVFIGEWISTDVDAVLTSILGKYPNLSNKKLFSILEPPSASVSSSIGLIKHNTINYEKIFENYSDSTLVAYFTATQRGIDYDQVQKYLSGLEGGKFPETFNKLVMYKNLNDKDNLKNQILYTLNHIGYNNIYGEPNFTGSLIYGIYRERWYSNLEDYMRDYFDSSKLKTIGLLESTMYVSSQQLQTYYAIIDSLESKGFNVIPVVAAGGTVNQLKVMVHSFTNGGDVLSFLVNSSLYKTYVDAIVSMPAYGIGGESFDNATLFFEELGVPVFRAIHSDYVRNEEYELSNTGLPVQSSDKWWHVTIAEAQGIIDATFIGGASKRISTTTGAEITGYVPHLKNIDLLGDRVSAWVNLQYTNNSDKKLSIIYYNYPPGKQNIGSSYLDSITSIYNLLYTLKGEGYNLGELPSTVSELENMMIESGINVANWAPGELEKLANRSNIVLVPVSDYLAWFNTLDDIVRLQVIEGPVAYIGELARAAVNINYIDSMDSKFSDWYNQVVALLPEDHIDEAKIILDNIIASLKVYISSGNQSDYEIFLKYKADWQSLNLSGLNGWGDVPGNIMTITINGTEYFVIPGIKFANVFIGPEPQRGWEADSDALYHSAAVAPTHQYLAAYYYMQSEYSDAMVFVGRHGTHEWLPGKEVLLSTNDFGSIVVGDCPQIYFYIVDGLAEGIQSKRRGFAVMISHLTSPMAFTSLYGNLTLMSELIELYENTTNPSIKETLAIEIKNIIDSNNLIKSMNIKSLDNLNSQEIIDVSINYLKEIQNNLYPLGLHGLGQVWTDEDIANTVSAILSADFDYGNGTTNLFDEISYYLYNTDYDSLSPAKREKVLNSTLKVLKALIYWDVSVVSGAINYTSPGFIYALNLAKTYISLLNQSISNEISSFISALNGNYVAVGNGGDIIFDPSILTTGGNFFEDQSKELPTKEAYEYAKILTLLSLADLTDSVEKLIMGIWCVETARDNGALVSVVLYLLGMEAVWTSSPSAGGADEHGERTGTKVQAMPKYIELNDLVRPDGWDKKRIDVTVITSGLFRDLYSTQSSLMDNGFRVALARSYYTIIGNTTLTNSKYGSEMLKALNSIMDDIAYYGVSNESLDDNYIAKHWVSDFFYYKSLGYDTVVAGEYAIIRIFAPPNGDYGAGISKAVQMSWTWNDTDELAEFYLERMGNMYSKHYWGDTNPAVFARALNESGSLIVSRNTNQYGVTDNDDFFDYWGGLSMTIDYVTGSTPNMNVLMYANKNNPYISSLETVLNKELISREFNPEWIAGMMKEGYSGARYMSNKFTSNLLGWAVTRPSAVDNWMWDSVVGIYVNDKYNLGLNDWLKSGNNAYSYISMTGTLLTAAYEGYWSTDSGTLSQVANEWARTVLNNGVACCDCSCGNIAMMEWAIDYINPDMLAQFKEVMFAATYNNAFTQNNNPVSPNDPTDGGGSSPSNTGGSQSLNGEFGSSDTRSNSSSSSSNPQLGQSPGVSEVSASQVNVGSSSEGESGASHEVTKAASSSFTPTEVGMSIVAIIGVVVIVFVLGFGYQRRKDDE